MVSEYLRKSIQLSAVAAPAASTHDDRSPTLASEIKADLERRPWVSWISVVNKITVVPFLFEGMQSDVFNEESGE